MLAKICESSEPKTASSFCGLQSYHLSTEAVNVFLSAKSPDEISRGFVKTLTRRDIAKL
jgi:hypothetical protein